MAVGVEGHAANSLLLHERCEYYMNAASKAEFRAFQPNTFKLSI
jgi:hypothetical protein